jgi:hypothetical protein
MSKEQNNQEENKALHIGSVRRSHLRFDCMYGMLEGQETPKGHPQEIMKRLGITYQHATPQSISDQWWFWNCENMPEELPPYLELTDWNPMEMIGWGLSKENAEAIRDYA